MIPLCNKDRECNELKSFSYIRGFGEPISPTSCLSDKFIKMNFCQTRRILLLKMIEEMKKEAALHPPVELTSEEEEAAKEMIRRVLETALYQND